MSVPSYWLLLVQDIIILARWSQTRSLLCLRRRSWCESMLYYCLLSQVFILYNVVLYRVQWYGIAWYCIVLYGILWYCMVCLSKLLSTISSVVNRHIMCILCWQRSDVMTDCFLVAFGTILSCRQLRSKCMLILCTNDCCWNVLWCLLLCYHCVELTAVNRCAFWITSHGKCCPNLHIPQ